MIDNQESNTVFLKPLVTFPKIEVGEFTYYSDADDPALFETKNVLYTAGQGRGPAGLTAIHSRPGRQR
jgi:virginiamycin A acetyltransferase